MTANISRENWDIEPRYAQTTLNILVKVKFENRRQRSVKRNWNTFHIERQNMTAGRNDD